MKTLENHWYGSQRLVATYRVVRLHIEQSSDHNMISYRVHAAAIFPRAIPTYGVYTTVLHNALLKNDMYVYRGLERM